MKNVARLTMYAGVGLFDKVREEIEDLVKRGEMKQNEGELLLGTIESEAEEKEVSRLKKIPARIEALAKKAVDRLPPVVIQRELKSLELRIDDLQRRLDKLEAREPVPQ